MEDMNTNKNLENNTSEEKGNVKISVDVVATIAGIAANEIEGVAGMCGSIAGGIAEFLGSKKSATKGVKVEIQEEIAIIDLYVIVDYGIRIPELAWEIQENVKQSVESMTGLSVEKVNIHIDGVSFEKENAKNSADDILVEDIEIEEVPEDGSEYL